MISARLLFAVFFALCGAHAGAQESVFEARQFSDATHESRYRQMISELRCLVCQNQAISDSNADLARQLRDEVHERILAGESDEQILEFMTSRYGDYVLFSPPVRNSTVLLWGGPFVLLLLALGFLFQQIRKHQLSGDDDDIDAKLD